VIVVELVVAIALAMFVHELGHFVVAHIVGGNDVRLHRSGLIFSVEAVLPSQRATAAFLVAGCVTNVVAAVGFVVVDRPILALVQLACALVNAVPHSTSDGAKLRRKPTAPALDGLS
jgi:hypothetical protein